MKPLLALAGCAILCGAVACGPPRASGDASQPGRLERVLETGELRVGLTGTQPPLNMKGKSGELIGLDVDLIDALAEAMKVKPRMITYEFSELLPALERGEIDLVISGMTITAERNARVSFAGPYFISGKSLITKSDDLADAQSSEELNASGRSFAALAGSTSEEFVNGFLSNAKLVSTANYAAGVKLVLDDQVDALVADFPFCMLTALRHPEAELATLMTPLTTEPLGIALPADDPLFVNLVQNYLSTLETTGLLSQLKAKWFSEGPWVGELP